MENLYSDTPEAPRNDQAKVKNLTALIILLAGLFLGSLLVDFVQLMTGEGFSGRMAKTYNVLPTREKTWVAYTDPKVSLQLINDKDCAACDPSEALVWLRRVLPTLEVTTVESTSREGQALTLRHRITALPAFLFSPQVARTDFYKQASSLFLSEGGKYTFDMQRIGLQAGKYLKLPKFEEGALLSGSQDAPVKVVTFTDFQCPFCKNFHKDLTETVRGYGDEVGLVYKYRPLTVHKQGLNAALASECAHEQGKFGVYVDYLFAKQGEWGTTLGTQKFKDYAWYLKLDGRKFSQCLDSKKYNDKVISDSAEADSFSVEGTPATFVNGVFLDGAVSREDLKKVIDTELEASR